MPGINPDDYENCSVEELYEKLRGQSIHSTLYVRIKNVIDRKTGASQEAHRTHELKEWAMLHKANLDLQADVRKIEKKVEQPKSEFRTWSLWVAIIALTWQIGEKIPWQKLLSNSQPLPAASMNPPSPGLSPNSVEKYQPPEIPRTLSPKSKESAPEESKESSSSPATEHPTK